MSKGHRDNHEARKKRGPKAFEKKRERREKVRRRNRAKCSIHGGFDCPPDCPERGSKP